MYSKKDESQKLDKNTNTIQRLEGILIRVNIYIVLTSIFIYINLFMIHLLMIY